MSKRTELGKLTAAPSGALMVHYNTDQMRTIHPEEANEIARRCNVHDELVEALEGFETASALWLPEVVEVGQEFEAEALHGLRSKMLAALKKARGDT